LSLRDDTERKESESSPQRSSGSVQKRLTVVSDENEQEDRKSVYEKVTGWGSGIMSYFKRSDE
jgi:hypothetical protein